jgi:hypothetical protein
MADDRDEKQQDGFAKLAGVVDEFLETVRLEEAGRLPEGARSATDLKPNLDTSYWRLMTEEIGKVVKDNLPENLEFDQRLQWALNYGVLRDHPAFAWALEQVGGSMPNPPGHPEYQCVYTTHALNGVYRTILKIDTIRKLKETVDRISKAIEESPGEREESIAQRNRVIDGAAKDPGDAKKLKDAYAKLDGSLERYKLMEKKNREGGFGGQDERQAYIQLTQERNGLVEQVDKLLSYFREVSGEIRKFDVEADGHLNNLIALRDEKRQKEKDIDREKSAVTNVSLLDVRAGLEEAVATIKGNGRLTSKLGKAMQISLPLDERELVTPALAYEALAKIEEYDPNLFNNRGVKRKGKPEIFIVPGIGEGIYDWEGNRLMIPIMHTRGILPSVASAVVLYRVDIDQSYNDREMILSYKNDIKEHKKVKSMIKLRQQLIKDYLLWVTKESMGLPLMEKANREWFEYRIGPNKYDPKYPSDMRGLTLKQQREGLEAELAKPESPDVIFRQGLFYLLMDPENTESINREVCPRLEKAHKLAPNNHDMLYSLAAVYRKIKNKKCVELFIEYTKQAPQSWWSKKAVELVNTFK